MSSAPDLRDRSPERYRDLLDAAERVIARQGYARAQVSRIAAEAGVAGGTVYLYFRNKQDVLISLFRERFERFFALIDDRLRDVDDARDMLLGLVEVHLGALAERPDLARVTQIEMRQADPHIRRGIDEAMAPYFTRIDSVLRAGQAAGLWRADVDLRVAKRMIFGTLDQCVTAWVMSGCKYDLTSLVEPVGRLLLNALALGDPVATRLSAKGEVQ